MFSASPSFIDVTTFHAARPPVIRSSVANTRATWNGSKYVVEQVAPRPSRSVAMPITVSTVIGSIFTQRMPCSTVWRWSLP